MRLAYPPVPLFGVERRVSNPVAGAGRCKKKIGCDEINDTIIFHRTRRLMVKSSRKGDRRLSEFLLAGRAPAAAEGGYRS
jgi:hypothetical protein